MGLDRRRERYWLIERRCKDLCLYLDVLTRNMPRYEKYVLSAKMREIGYLCLELAIAVFFGRIRRCGFESRLGVDP